MWTNEATETLILAYRQQYEKNVEINITALHSHHSMDNLKNIKNVNSIFLAVNMI